MSDYLTRIALAADLAEFAGDNGLSITDAEAMALVNMTDAELISILQAGIHPRHVPYRRGDIRRAAAWVVAFRKLPADEQQMITDPYNQRGAGCQRADQTAWNHGADADQANWNH